MADDCSSAVETIARNMGVSSMDFIKIMTTLIDNKMIIQAFDVMTKFMNAMRCVPNTFPIPPDSIPISIFIFRDKKIPNVYVILIKYMMIEVNTTDYVAYFVSSSGDITSGFTSRIFFYPVPRFMIDEYLDEIGIITDATGDLVGNNTERIEIQHYGKVSVREPRVARGEGSNNGSRARRKKRITEMEEEGEEDEIMEENEFDQ